MATSALVDFHRAAPATIGCLLLVPAIGFTILAGRRSGRNLIPTWHDLDFFLLRAGLYFSLLVVFLAGFFHFFGTEWFLGYQLAYFSLLGFYAAWTLDEEYLLMYVVLGLFNWLGLSGHNPLLGYGNNMAEIDFAHCMPYFDDATRCSSTGYLNFLRLLGIVAILFQGIAAFCAFRIYRTPDISDRTKGTGGDQQQGSSYESIFDASRKPNYHTTEPHANSPQVVVSSYQGIPSDNFVVAQ